VANDSDQDARQALPTLEPGKVRKTPLKDYVVRFVLGAVIAIAAHILSKSIGARFGGVFLAFPAILPASLTLIQEKEGTRRADRDAIGAVLGGFGLAVFAMIGELAFTRLEPYLVLAFALLGWIVASLALYVLFAFLRPTHL
jgi:hypothetical protein